MTVQEKALEAYYNSITDSELLKLAANRSSFIDAAQQAMAREIRSRNLTQGTTSPSSSPGQPGEPEPGVPRSLVTRLTRVFARQRK